MPSDGLFNNNATNGTSRVEAIKTFFDTNKDIVNDFQSQYNFSDTSYNISSTEKDHVVRYMFLYHALGYLWVVEFIKGIGTSYIQHIGLALR
jgi:hypothetical protein